MSTANPLIGQIAFDMADPDDDPILACAISGKANYLVSYDPHLTSLGDTYQGVKISEALPFLRALRGL